MTKSPLSNTRLLYLDSIRGIAALLVVVMHFIGWKWGESVQFKLAAFVFNGTEAVSFFFVLSGFVLSYSYINSERKIKPLRYLYRRVLRLYPAYIVNIMLLFFYYRGGIILDNRFPYKELLMFQRTHDLYLPGWTMRIEIIYSVLIIGLIFLYKKQPYLLLIPFIACYFIGPPDTRIYMNHFILGIVLASVYPRIKNIAFSETKLYAWRWPIYSMLLFLFSLVRLQEYFPSIENMLVYLWSLDIRVAHFSGLAAFLFLILVVMNKHWQIALEHKHLLYLGKISYSIYLVHWGLCIFIMNKWELWGELLGQGAIRFCVMFVLYLGTTIIVANLLYRFIEEPFIKLGQRSKSRIVSSSEIAA